MRDIHAILSGALGTAARYGWIAFNPAVLARPPAQHSVSRVAPTANEVRDLLAEAAAEPDLELFLRLAATTGLRPGELCALRWVDLDLEAAELYVTGNIVHARASPAAMSESHQRAFTASASWRSTARRSSSWRPIGCGVRSGRGSGAVSYR